MTEYCLIAFVIYITGMVVALVLTAYMNAKYNLCAPKVICFLSWIFVFIGFIFFCVFRMSDLYDYLYDRFKEKI